MWTKEKLEAGKKLKMTKEQVMCKVTAGLPAKLQWIRSEDQLDTLYEVVSDEKSEFGLQIKLQRQEQGKSGYS